MRKPSGSSGGQGYRYFAAGNLDSRALDDGRKNRLANSLTSTLSSLTGPLTILVRRRRYHPPAKVPRDTDSELDIAINAWMTQEFAANPGWRHEIIFGTSDRSEE